MRFPGVHLRRALVATLAALAAAGLPACGKTGGRDKGKDKGDKGKGGASTGEATGAECESYVPPEISYARRLSNQEYFHALTDLFKLDLNDLRGFFPADSVTGGFTNSFLGNDTTPLHVTKYEEAAKSLAAKLMASPTFGGKYVEPCAADDKCHMQAMMKYGRLFMRGYMDDAERDVFFALYKKVRNAGKTPPQSVEIVLRAMLQSPRFLYRVEGGDSGDQRRPLDVVTKLASFLWQSTPDEAQIKAWEKREAFEPGELEALVDAMLGDPRARRSYRNFVRQWLAFDGFNDIQKDPAKFPEFNAELKTQMIEDTVKTLETIAFAGEPLLGMFTTRRSFAKPELARHYGLTPKGEGLVEYEHPEGSRRKGVLTHASLLTMLADRESSSPIRRGRFVSLRFLCRVIPPPPPDVPLVAIDAKGKSLRERLEAHSKNASCKSCHRFMDGLGFGFERYDALGKWRETYEGGDAIDTSATVYLSEDDGTKFQSVDELSDLLAGSPEVKRCFIQTFYLFAQGHELDRGNECELSRLSSGLDAKTMTYRDVVMRIVTSPSFLKTSAP